MNERIHLVVFLFSTSLAPVLAETTVCNEPNVAAIVVASIFGTLAVVLVIAGIVLFILWRKRRAQLGKPPRKSPQKGLPSQGESGSPERGFNNPAFDDTDSQPNIIDAEEGLSRTNGSPGKLQSPKGLEAANKTWMSLPKADFPASGLQRQGSCGSLDDNYLSLDPEVISVWLQSQDFIGLGFNITGSMRDGIFVSQVHNRGPAIESGKIKVGDRIQSVTISFENMVFEDALTILSYASPYPVKVTLQKEKQFPSDHSISSSDIHLSHPFYRSQSLDALTRIGKESILKQKRTFSEMKPETRKRNSKLEKETSQNSSTTNTIPGLEIPMDGGTSDTTLSDIGKHGLFLTSDANHNQLPVSVSEKPAILTDIVVHSRETSGLASSKDSRKSSDTDTESSTHNDDGGEMNASSVSKEPQRPPSEISSDFADIFSGFNSLSNFKFDSEPKSDSVIAVAGSVEASLEDNDVKDEMKPIPRKPERRNKKSLSTSSSFDDDDGYPNLITEKIESTSISATHTAPKQSYVNKEVIEENIIPQKKERDFSMNTSNFDFTPIDLNVSSMDMSTVGDVSSSFTTISGCTSTPMKTLEVDSDSSIEEDVITPSKAMKDKASPPFPLLRPQDTPVKNDISSKFDELQKLDTFSSSNESSVSSNDGADKEPVNKTDPDDLIRPIESGFDIFKLRPSTKIKEGSSGVSYNISMSELNDIEEDINRSKNKDISKNKSNENRYQFSSGWPSLEKSAKLVVNRTVSDTSKPPPLIESETKTMRVSSVKSTEKKVPLDIEPVNLEWSGKRLVRSGSFESFPKDDGTLDWTENNKSVLKMDDSSQEIVSDEKIRIDADETMDSYHGLSSAHKFQAMENLANLSDLTDSNPSSRSSSPVDDGVQNGRTTISLTKPIVFRSDSLNSPKYQYDYEGSKWTRTDQNAISPSTYESPGNYTVTMTFPPSDDAEC